MPRVFEQFGCRVTHDMEAAIRDADVINLLRINTSANKTMFPSIGEYTAMYGLNRTDSPAPSPTSLSCIPAQSIAASRLTATLRIADARLFSNKSPTA